MPAIHYYDSVATADFIMKKQVSKGLMRDMHVHRTYELYYLINGDREYFIEDRFFTVKEGDLVLIPKNVMHRTGGSGGLRFLMHFTEALLEKYFTATTISTLMNDVPFVFRTDPAQADHILSILNTMLDEYNRLRAEQTPKNEHLLSGYLYQLLFTMAYTNNTYVHKNAPDNRITQIIQYIGKNYNHINDIEQIAEHFFISKYHLCRYFQKNLGISLVSYLNTIKIKEACKLIKGGCTNMTQVAIQCGFNSSSYFCKVFKKEKGISPSEYKKNHSK